MEEAYSSFTSSIKKAACAPSRTMSSPFMDAVRTARASATKEFDQFYGYISKVMTPRRSQIQSTGNIIHKPLPQTAKRIRRHSNKSTSSLTPIIERRPLSTETMAPYQNINDRYLKSPSRHAHSRQRKQSYPPVRPMTLSPITMRSYSDLGNSHSFDLGSVLPQQEDDDNDDQGTNVHLYTPQRSTSTTANNHSFHTNTTPSRITYSTPIRKTTRRDSSVSASLCPSSPSVVLQDHLQDESRRLEQLQHDVFIAQQQSLALSQFGTPSSSSSSSCTRRLMTNDHILGKTGSYLPARQQQQPHVYPASTEHLQRKKEYTHTSPLYDHYHRRTQTQTTEHSTLSSSLPPSSPAPVFTTSTPLGSPSTTTHRQTNPLFSAQHLLPSMPRTPTSSTSSNTQPRLIPPSPPIAGPSNTTPSPSQHRQRYQKEMMDDISKSPLRPDYTISTPTRSRIISNNNEFWKKIHEDLDNEPSSLHQHHLGTSRKSASPSPPPPQQQADENEMCWVNDDDNNPNQEKRHHGKTLDQELGMAKDKFDTLQQQQQQQQIQAKSFSLRPSGTTTPLFLDDDDDDDDNTQPRGMIDGDRWTFAGQHYIVDEKKQ